MKKLGIVSFALAALLFSGCGEKKEQKAHVEQKSEQAVAAKTETQAPAQKATEQAQSATQESAKVEESKGEAGDQAPAQSATEEIKESAKEVGEQAKAKVEEAVEGAKQAAAAAVGAVTGSVTTKEENNETTAMTDAAVGAATTKVEQSETATAVDGAKHYAKCASCHGPKGDRKALGKSGIIAGMAKDEVLKKLKGYQAGTLNKYGMGPLMKGQVAGLSEAELEALADYISKLK